MLKRKGYDHKSYHQRNKTETIFSVIKRMFGDNVTSRKISTQNRELMYRVIAYNAYRITRDCLLIWHGFYTAYGLVHADQFLVKNFLIILFV